jgi:hypothetical protein
MNRMRRIGLAATIVRRTLLVVLLVILLPHSIQKWVGDNDRGRGINDPMKELQADGAVTTIPVGRSFRIDDDTFTADAVYVTSKQLMITYTYRAKEKYAWSFPAMSLQLVTPDGQRLVGHSSGSNGTSWGERGYVSYDLPDPPAAHATLIYDRYDRSARLELPLSKAGDET